MWPSPYRPQLFIGLCSGLLWASPGCSLDVRGAPATPSESIDFTTPSEELLELLTDGDGGTVVILEGPAHGSDGAPPIHDKDNESSAGNESEPASTAGEEPTAVENTDTEEMAVSDPSAPEEPQPEEEDDTSDADSEDTDAQTDMDMPTWNEDDWDEDDWDEDDWDGEDALDAGVPVDAETLDDEAQEPPAESDEEAASEGAYDDDSAEGATDAATDAATEASETADSQNDTATSSDGTPAQDSSDQEQATEADSSQDEASTDTSNTDVSGAEAEDKEDVADTVVTESRWNADLDFEDDDQSRGGKRVRD